ncbi:MAG: hypothetical protein U5R31_04265, partial [Acidimicrobiia bacterium]|nr:hypothetical protein [Acidimicrobiia bacterium]
PCSCPCWRSGGRPTCSTPEPPHVRAGLGRRRGRRCPSTTRRSRRGAARRSGASTHEGLQRLGYERTFASEGVEVYERTE